MKRRSNNRDAPEGPDSLPEKARKLKDTVKWFIISEELIPSDGIVLAAVSGGQDSMAMLSLLNDLSRELHFRLVVGHFDHRLRVSSREDRAVVEHFADSLSLNVYSGSEDVKAIAERDREPLEEAARKARYKFLFSAADNAGATCIATGHTKSDQVETVVMRFLRGSGIRGLAGIPARRGKLIRPLLSADREATDAYCKARNIPYVVDPSNMDTRIFRNKIRLELLPFLRKIQPAVDGNILRISDNARALIASIREKTWPLLKQHSRKLSENEWMLNVTKLMDLDKTSLTILFGDLFSAQMHLDMDFARVHYEELIRLSMNASASGKKLSLPGLTVKREYENLIFTRAADNAPPTMDSVNLTLPIPGETPLAGMTFRTEVFNRKDLEGTSFRSGSNSAYFDADRISPPIIIRRPSPGDRMQPFGMPGSKKLSDIFIDKKIPGRERAKSLIIADRGEIIWLVGAATCEKGRIGEKTEKIMKITVEKE